MSEITHFVAEVTCACGKKFIGTNITHDFNEHVLDEIDKATDWEERFAVLIVETSKGASQDA